MVDTGLLFYKMLVMLIMMCVGFAARKTNVMTSESNHSLTMLINNITMPCLVIYSAVSNDHALSNRQVLGLLGIAFAAFAVFILTAKLITALIRPERGRRGIYEYFMIFPNSSFIGIPVISAIYGASATFFLSLFNLPFYLILYSYGISLIQEIPMRKINVRQLLSPLMFASLLSIALYFGNVQLPKLIAEPMQTIAQISTPGAMLLVGSMLAGIPVKGLFQNGKLFLAAAGKLMVVPAVTSLIFRLFVQDEMMLGIVTLVAAMPTASNTSLLAAQYGKDEDMAATIVFLTTVCSVATIPLMAMLLL